MSEAITIENVVLRGNDLKVVWSLWPSVNRANNWRLVPIAVGALVSAFSLSFLTDPTAWDLLTILGPVVIGFYIFLWLTNGVFMGALRRGYEVSPTGAAPCTFRFDDEGMQQSLSVGGCSYRWAAFVDVVESADGFRFWMTPYMAVMLPVRFMDDAQKNALRALLVKVRARGELRGAQ
ncbi:MAG: YcxB family protein [Caulobacterales bacterium]|nr:YcxB family protein [Caulobacterales bacterium]